MHDRLFYSSLEKIDEAAFEITSAKKNNDALFRRLSKEVFQKSFSKVEFQSNLDAGARMAGVGIASAIQIARGRYKKDSFTKSFKKLHRQTDVVTFSDLNKINQFLQTSEFASVVKLLKIKHNYGLHKAVSVISE